MTLAEARTEVLDILVRERRGEDPSGVRLAARQAPTASDLADQYMDEHARIKKKARNVTRDQPTGRSRRPSRPIGSAGARVVPGTRAPIDHG